MFLWKKQTQVPELNSSSEDWKTKIFRCKEEVFHLYELLEDLNKINTFLYETKQNKKFAKEYIF